MYKYWNFNCESATLPGSSGTKSKDTGTFLDTKVVSESDGTCLEVMEQCLKALEVYE